MLKIIRVKDERRTYTGSDGVERVSSNLYGEVDINGNKRRFVLKTLSKNDSVLLGLAVDEFVHIGIDGLPVKDTEETPSKK